MWRMWQETRPKPPVSVKKKNLNPEPQHDVKTETIKFKIWTDISAGSKLNILYTLQVFQNCDPIGIHRHAQQAHHRVSEVQSVFQPTSTKESKKKIKWSNYYLLIKFHEQMHAWYNNFQQHFPNKPK